VGLNGGGAMSFNGRKKGEGAHAIESLVTRDGGKTWVSGGEVALHDHKVSPQTVVKDKEGTISLFYIVWVHWEFKDLKKNKSQVWVVQSTDDGETWVEPSLVQGGSCGGLIGAIVTSKGHIVLPIEGYIFEPGPERIVIDVYVSPDGGATWQVSNRIDLGAGDVFAHSGAIEPDVVELSDGRLLLLIRTIWDRFWYAYSEDQGRSWRTILPSPIPASNSPGYIHRLSSGRLALVWNEGKGWYRDELSIAFSEDDAKTWSEPIKFIGTDKSVPKPRGFSYPVIFEPEPGLLWIAFTQQSEKAWTPRLVSVREADLAGD